LLAACASQSGESTPSGSTVPAELLPSPARTAANPTASPSSTTQRSQAPSASALATPYGAAVFSDPDDCTNPELGYRVAYPASWYSNAAMDNPLNPQGEGISSCWLFAPTEFLVVYGSEIPAEVAVVITAHELSEGVVYDYDPPSNARIESESTTTAAGLSARYQELEITERDIAHQVGDRVARYIIQVNERRYLTAETYRGSDYLAAKAVLDQMVLTLQLVLP
jgi:hypothetical protein